MALKDPRAIQTELARPFAPEDLEWRLQRTFEIKGEMVGIAVPYVTNRAIQNRLDSVVGPENWYNDFKPWHRFTMKVKSDYDPKQSVDKEVISQLCGIAIYFEERKEWVMKWDGADNSDIEPAKGGLSDSMKRAAGQWGIGRVLYNMDTVLVDVEKKGRSWFIQKAARTKLDKAYLDMLKVLGLKPAPAGGIQSLLADGNATLDGRTDDTSKRADTPAIPPKDGDTAQKSRQAPAKQAEQTPEPEYEFIVSAAQIQKGMNSKNTFVRLRSADGKEINAFAQGEHLMLAPGVMLTNTKLSTRQQDAVVYFILESYQIVPQDQRAA